MTREDLLKGNCKIAADFGENIKKYCPDVKHVVVIFNPADVTALTALIHSGLKPNQLTSLAALDSTRLQQALAHEFGVQQDKVTGAHTYGGHGEQMAVFASQVKVDGKPLSEMGLSAERWEEIKHHTVLVFTTLSQQVLQRRWLLSRLLTSTSARCVRKSSASTSYQLLLNGRTTMRICKQVDELTSELSS